MLFLLFVIGWWLFGILSESLLLFILLMIFWKNDFIKLLLYLGIGFMLNLSEVLFGIELNCLLLFIIEYIVVRLDV